VPVVARIGAHPGGQVHAAVLALAGLGAALVLPAPVVPLLPALLQLDERGELPEVRSGEVARRDLQDALRAVLLNVGDVVGDRGGGGHRLCSPHPAVGQ
jgi:hypothetical protein